VGEVEANPRPIARPNAFSTKARADVVIAPAIAGPHVKPTPGLTTLSGISESDIEFLAFSANQEMRGLP
jgi:hypothetical protein